MRSTASLLLVLGLLASPLTVSAQDESVEPSSDLRVAAELGVALAVMGASVGSGLLLGADGPGGDLLLASATGFFGGFVMAGAVTGVGDALGGNGGAGWATLGTMLGGLLAAPLVFAAMVETLEECDTSFETCDPHDEAYAGLAAFALPAIGAVLGYELSNDSGEASDQDTPRFGISPTARGNGVFGSVQGDL